MSKNSALTWRVNDIVVASVLAVACGLLYWFWSAIGYDALKTTLILAPEFASLFGGVWLLAGVLGGLLIRKPGAALYTELLAAIISALIGTHYSAAVVLSGLIQGLGAELVFALFLYKVWNLGSSLASGAVAGLFMGASEFIIYYAGEMTPDKGLVYTVCGVVSGLFFAGLLAWLLQRALLPTGVLDSLASGRSRLKPRGGR